MINCEFRRNIWLEFTPTKLLISPVVVGAVVVIVYLAQDTGSAFFESLLVTSGLLTGFVLLLWAMKQAAESITSEENERTWVFQRMSSITAFDMTIGKLLGSTAYAWYSAAFLLIAYVVSAFNTDKTKICLKFGLLLVLSSIVGHALSMLVSLIVVKNARFTGKCGKNSVFLLGAGIGLFILSMSPAVFSMHGTDVRWFSLSINVVDFLLFTAAYAAFWSVVGLYRMVRTELQYDNTPLFWCIFVFSLLVYFHGLTVGSPEFAEVLHGNAALWLSFLILVILSYFTLMTESFEPVAIRKIIDRLQKRRWKEAAFFTPLWVPTFAAVIGIREA